MIDRRLTFSFSKPEWVNMIRSVLPVWLGLIGRLKCYISVLFEYYKCFIKLCGGEFLTESFQISCSVRIAAVFEGCCFKSVNDIFGCSHIGRCIEKKFVLFIKISRYSYGVCHSFRSYGIFGIACTKMKQSAYSGSLSGKFA